MNTANITNPKSGDLVIYSQSGRSSYLGVLLNWPNTGEKVVYGFERNETLWANQVMVISAPSDAYAKMCQEGRWKRFLAGTVNNQFITALVHDGKMHGDVCELAFTRGSKTYWFPLQEVTLVAHLDAKEPTLP